MHGKHLIRPKCGKYLFHKGIKVWKTCSPFVDIYHCSTLVFSINADREAMFISPVVMAFCDKGSNGDHAK